MTGKQDETPRYLNADGLPRFFMHSIFTTVAGKIRIFIKLGVKLSALPYSLP
jgi:hypothetical protein